MSKVVLYIASSIDGYIAGPKGELDWLNAIEAPKKGDYGYSELLNRTDTIIMGRKTYDMIIGFGIDWPYPNHKSYVITTDTNYVASSPKTEVIDTDINELVSQLKLNNKKDIWLMGGGQLIVHFLKESLLDEMILTSVPVMLGKGIPLFPSNEKSSNWSLSKSEVFDTGLVNNTYTVKSK